MAAAAAAQASAGPAHADITGDSVDELPAVALAERVEDFNISMDPSEQTGAPPQGWAAHLHQTVIPVQEYIQLRPQDTTLPSFGSGPTKHFFVVQTMDRIVQVCNWLTNWLIVELIKWLADWLLASGLVS